MKLDTLMQKLKKRYGLEDVKLVLSARSVNNWTNYPVLVLHDKTEVAVRAYFNSAQLRSEAGLRLVQEDALKHAVNKAAHHLEEQKRLNEDWQVSF